MATPASALQSAKDAMKKSDEFVKSVEGRVPGMYDKKSAAPAPKVKATPAAPKPAAAPPEGRAPVVMPSTESGGEVKARQQNIKDYETAFGKLPGMKDGAVKVKGDQIAKIHDGESVLPKDKKKAGDIAMKHLGLSEGLIDAKEMKEEKAEGKKDNPKEEKAEHKKAAKKGKKKGPRVHTIHVKRAHGGFIVNHEHEMGPEGKTMSPEENPPHVVPDLEALKSHIEEHMGEGEGPEGLEEGSTPAPAPAMQASA